VGRVLCAAPPADRLARRLYRAARRWLLEARLRRGLAQPVRRIVVGASGVVEPGWLATEEDFLSLLRRDDWLRYFAACPVDAILAEHVWEHLGGEEGLAAARTCFEFLRPGGYVRVAVPDGLHPSGDYRARVRPGGTGAGAADHKVLYDYRSFGAVFQRAGFEVRLLEYYDETGQFHFREWDPDEGMVWRSKRFDPRNQAGRIVYTSIVLDAIKPRPA